MSEQSETCAAGQTDGAQAGGVQAIEIEVWEWQGDPALAAWGHHGEAEFTAAARAQQPDDADALIDPDDGAAVEHVHVRECAVLVDGVPVPEPNWERVSPDTPGARALTICAP